MASLSAQTAGRPQTEKTSPRDFRQEVTDSIVQMLERGVAPWQKPWEPGAGSLSMPFNPTSERAYRGGNAIHLMAAGLRNGFDDPRWMTYKQAADQGLQVRKGEKGTQSEFWEMKARDPEVTIQKCRQIEWRSLAYERERRPFTLHPSGLYRLQRQTDRSDRPIRAASHR
jgi:antirestriction protein ArdC